MKIKSGYRVNGGGCSKIRFIIACIFFTIACTLYPTPCLYCQTNPEVYFNSGIDKYVKGDYDGAIALFEQTLTEKPDHQKAKNFLVKVLIETTEKQILMSNFKTAKFYIDKASVIAPDNEKVNELQKVISGGYKKSKTVIYRETTAPVIKKSEPKKTVVVKQEEVKKEEAIPFEHKDDKSRSYILFSIISVVIILILVFVWMRKKASENAKKVEELKKQIRLEEEKKYKQELEKIKKLGEDKLKNAMERAESIKIRLAEKKAISKEDAEKAQKQLDASVESGKFLEIVSDNLENEEYSKQIIQKMTLSIRTIMNVNKKSAMENIIRLSKSENPRLRYDCVKIIENILTDETFKILLGLLADDDYEVKRASILAVNNVIKSAPFEISADSISAAKNRLMKEKIKNGWII